MPRLLTPEVEATRRAILATVPEATGVYLFYDRYDRPTYVGKSVNLRRRMASYFQAAGPSEPRVRSLRFGTRRFEYRVVPTELLALLLEDALIKQLNPDHNKAQRRLDEFRYLELSGDGEALTLRVVVAPSADAKSFGPFRNHFFAEELADVTRRWLLPAGASAATRFLEGDAGPLRTAAETAMERLVAAERFERAAELRDLLDRFERFCTRERFMRRFAAGTIAITDAEDVRYTFARGALIRAEAPRPIELPPELGDAPTDPRVLADRAAIVEAAARSAGAG
jgi:excinuclease UvrABC nuclease subunit